MAWPVGTSTQRHPSSTAAAAAAGCRACGRQLRIGVLHRVSSNDR